MARVFVAFASSDELLAGVISGASTEASCLDVEYIPWTGEDGSGSPVGKRVESWIDGSVGLVADISLVNENVTYEIGYAIGAAKDLRIVRNTSRDFNEVTRIGLLDTLIHDTYRTQRELKDILSRRAPPKNNWHEPSRNRLQPVYVISPSKPTPEATRMMSAIKKQTFKKFRSFKAWEISRLTAVEVWQQVAASFGLVVMWEVGDTLDAHRNNQRASLALGMARGLGIPAILLAPDRHRLPLDLADVAERFTTPASIDPILRRFRDAIDRALIDLEEDADLPMALLDSLEMGDPAAENEQESLKRYFLETEEFHRTLAGDVNVVTGRKGSGKTAVFLQVRDRIRRDKRNLVIDLNPEGFQLLKLKELIVQMTSIGARHEFVAAFWEYVVWLEIAYKILEKDERVAQRDWELGQRYEKLKKAFLARVDTGAGDFSERLRLLVDTIERRFSGTGVSEQSAIASSSILEVVYGHDIATFRDQLFAYLNLKGCVLFLFDNLDRIRSPSGFGDDDAVLLIGLIQSMQNIARRFRQEQIDFRWAVFLRSDVSEFVVKAMADYGKLAQGSLEWVDRDLLKRVLSKRILASLSIGDRDASDALSRVSVSTVHGAPALDFVVDASLMRPRYMIRLFESARRRAINMGRQLITEPDYDAALIELGWTVMGDLDRELMDIDERAENLLVDIGGLEGACGLEELRAAIALRTGSEGAVDRLIDVLLWSGCIGVDIGQGPRFIYDCGYRRAFIRTLLEKNAHAEVRLHPTLAQIFRAKAAAA